MKSKFLEELTEVYDISRSIIGGGIFRFSGGSRYSRLESARARQSSSKATWRVEWMRREEGKYIIKIDMFLSKIVRTYDCVQTQYFLYMFRLVLYVQI